MFNKKGLEMSFSWLFAIIAGAFILFLAIFISIKFASQGQYELDTTTAKNLDVLLNPLQTSIETGKVTSITLPSETRIYNECDNNGNFGTQLISVSQKTGMLTDWPAPAKKISFQSKYIFSTGIVEGKKFYIFAENFESPFKVASPLILISASKSYYFVDAPENVKDYLQQLQTQKTVENFYFGEHPADSIVICFGNSGEKCDVKVIGTCRDNCENEYDQGFVEKDGKRVSYIGRALMYSAIFSESEIYECQTKRLMQRVSELSRVYDDESKHIAAKNCNSEVEGELLQLSSAAKDYRNSDDLQRIKLFADDLDKKNEVAICKLY